MIGQERDNSWIRFGTALMIIAAVFVVLLYRDALMTRMTRVLAASDEEPIPVQLLQRTEYQMQAPGFGEITGLQSVPVPTPRTRSGGLKVAWLVGEGSWVKPGDTVIRFDDTEALLNLEKEENSLEANQHRMEVTETRQDTESTVLDIDRTDAELEYDYAMSVLPQDDTIFSKWDIIEAEIDAAFAQKRMENLDHKKKVQNRIARSDRQILSIERNKALAEVEVARQTLSSLELVAPVGGLVLYRRDHRNEDPQVGDEVWPGQVLVEIVDLAALQARVHVLERDAGAVREGQEVRIRLDAVPGREFRGTIRSVAALPQPLERNSPLKYLTSEVSISDAGVDLKWIKPGMPLEADVILTSYESCFVVPASALTLKDSKSRVFIREGEGFEEREVETGSSPHGISIILDGVEEGELIALQNPFETRKSFLPDFGKGTAAESSSHPPMRRFIRMR